MAKISTTFEIPNKLYNEIVNVAKTRKITVEALIEETLEEIAKKVEMGKEANSIPSSTSGASIELARLSFTTARDEILYRMKERSILGVAYLFGTFGLLSTAVGLNIDHDSRFFLACVGPFASCIVAANFLHESKVIEDLAKLIRYPLNRFFANAGSWAPLFDLSTRWNDAEGSGKSRIEWSKVISGTLRVVFTIHLPSLISWLVAWILYMKGPSLHDQTILTDPIFKLINISFSYDQPLGKVLLFVSATTWITAVFFTILSFRVRFERGLAPIYVPPEYDWVLTASVPDKNANKNQSSSNN